MIRKIEVKPNGNYTEIVVDGSIIGRFPKVVPTSRPDIFIVMVSSGQFALMEVCEVDGVAKLTKSIYSTYCSIEEQEPGVFEGASTGDDGFRHLSSKLESDFEWSGCHFKFEKCKDENGETFRLVAIHQLREDLRLTTVIVGWSRSIGTCPAMGKDWLEIHPLDANIQHCWLNISGYISHDGPN